MEVFTEFGEATSVRLHMNSKGRPRGFAHIEFANREIAVATVNTASRKPIRLAGHNLHVDFATGVRDRKPIIVQPSEKLIGDSIINIHSLRKIQIEELTSTGFITFKSKQPARETVEAINDTLDADGNTLVLFYDCPRRNLSSVNKGSRTRMAHPKFPNCGYR